MVAYDTKHTTLHLFNFPPGVSSGIQINYYRNAVIGDTVTIETQCVMQGRNLYYANIFIRNKATGKILQQGSHSKFIGGDFAKVLPDFDNLEWKMPKKKE